jgi:hypothetical protein
MVLYVEWVTHIAPPSFSYSLSNDGVSFGQEQTLFGGAFPLDQYPITPAFLTKGDQILGVVYGAVPNTTDFPDAQIFARWLQKKPIITDFAGVQYSPQGGYGPDRQWFQAPQSGSITGTLKALKPFSEREIGNLFIYSNGARLSRREHIAKSKKKFSENAGEQNNEPPVNLWLPRRVEVSSIQGFEECNISNDVEIVYRLLGCTNPLGNPCRRTW